MSSDLPSKLPKHSASNDKPEVLKSWKPKLFVLLLCIVSFYAGWQASRSHLVKECQILGAQVSFEGNTIFCQR